MRNIYEKLQSTYGDDRKKSPTPRNIQEAMAEGNQPFSVKLFFDSYPRFFRNSHAEARFSQQYLEAERYLQSMQSPPNNWPYEPGFFKHYVQADPNIFVNEESGEIFFAKFGDTKTFGAFGTEPPMDFDHACQLATSVFGKIERVRQSEAKQARKARKTR